MGAVNWHCYFSALNLCFEVHFYTAAIQRIRKIKALYFMMSIRLKLVKKSACTYDVLYKIKVFDNYLLMDKDDKEYT